MKMHLINILPALALMVAPLCTAQQPTPAPAPEQTAAPDKSNPYNIADPGLRQVLQDSVRAMKSVTELLESVQDKATADAVADKLKVRMMLMDELSFGLQYIPYPVVTLAMSDAGITKERVESLQKRLEDNHFYYSTALAAAMGAPEYLAMEQTSLSPEQLEELKQKLTTVATQSPTVTGGPGFSRETAWQLPPDKTDFTALILQELDSNHPIGQSVIHGDDGQIFMKYTVVLTIDSKQCPIEQWFNVTLPEQTEDDASPQEEEFDDEPEEETPVETPEDGPTEEDDEVENFDDMEITVEPGGKVEEEAPEFTPEQKAAALKTFVGAFKEMIDILQQVTDTATAQAAVPQVKAVRERMSNTTLNDIMHTISGMEIIEAMEQSGITPTDISKIEQRLEDADYYLCDELRRALNE
ncbi:MAG: hypothetical protein IJ943_00785 [Akkermansia sp.]|nr:hypothetical protein [Akkermansia sp.]